MFGLEHWEIEVVTDPVKDPEDDYANIDIEDYSDSARLSLGPLFFRSPEPKQRRIIAHELAHVPSYRTTRFVLSLKRFVPPDAWAIWHEEFERKEDVMTENLAQLFAERMPRLRLAHAKRKR